MTFPPSVLLMKRLLLLVLQKLEDAIVGSENTNLKQEELHFREQEVSSAFIR